MVEEKGKSYYRVLDPRCYNKWSVATGCHRVTGSFLERTKGVTTLGEENSFRN